MYVFIVKTSEKCFLVELHDKKCLSAMLNVYAILNVYALF